MSAAETVQTLQTGLRGAICKQDQQVALHCLATLRKKKQIAELRTTLLTMEFLPWFLLRDPHVGSRRRQFEFVEAATTFPHDRSVAIALMLAALGVKRKPETLPGFAALIMTQNLEDSLQTLDWYICRNGKIENSRKRSVEYLLNRLTLPHPLQIRLGYIVGIAYLAHECPPFTQKIEPTIFDRSSRTPLPVPIPWWAHVEGKDLAPTVPPELLTAAQYYELRVNKEMQKDKNRDTKALFKSIKEKVGISFTDWRKHERSVLKKSIKGVES